MPRRFPSGCPSWTLAVAIFSSAAGCAAPAPPQPVEAPDPAPTEWLLHHGEGFSVRYPPGALVDLDGPGLTRFRYLGPDARPNTEINDGFMFTIGPRPLEDAANARAFAAGERERAADIGDASAGLAEVSFAGREAFQYRTQTVAETTHLIVPMAGDRVLSLAWSISGDERDRDRYRQMVERMRTSVELRDRVVEIALLDTERMQPGVERGCDAVIFATRAAPDRGHPAESALRALFDIEQVRVDGLYNFIARTRDTLHLDRVDVADGTARVHLSGRLSGLGGVCDNPRARIQIEETARRAEGVGAVELVLNGQVTDLQPDARGAGAR